MKSFSSREILKILTEDGWYHVATVGDHHQFKHPTKKGKVTVTHPVKGIPAKTVKSILKQAGITIE
ncbi:type II toxin-antitoxin system HicA family toxin [Desulfocucumis palustris]|uniref:type II toxin-antitoxin system HicA family toxin n=1 Tax=Desulfocucumis palustris TaxID=1898651 RepID=UPI000CE9CBBD|nr:type II toxin-antitoxin system HicA family toxin [Desulfocucumis palustris]